MGYSGAGGKLIHEKKQKQKSRDTVPLNQFVVFCLFYLWELKINTEKD